VNLAPAKAVASIGDLIRMFATSSHGGIATEALFRTRRIGPGVAHRRLYQHGHQIEAVVGGP